jgi:putative phosphoribosyl transferase
MTTSLTTQAGDRPALIPADQVTLPGTLAWPSRPGGIVIFAHGSGSSRLSPRNQYVARHLQGAGLATLLFDLLTEPEASDRANVFDIPLLARRLLAGARWVAGQPEVANLPIGLFGASTGAAAALIAAAMAPESVAAVVSRGGRPDLAGDYLPRVRAPTLLLVGSHDQSVLLLNREALARLTCPKRLAVIPGASHLFEEPGTLEDVAKRAAEWFVQYRTA